jgi:hypothetical protein
MIKPGQIMEYLVTLAGEKGAVDYAMSAKIGWRSSRTVKKYLEQGMSYSTIISGISVVTATSSVVMSYSATLDKNLVVPCRLLSIGLSQISDRLDQTTNPWLPGV